MSKMTSSSHHRGIDSNSKKVLTDFSIDSIIGGPTNDGHKSHNQRKLNHSKNDRELINTSNRPQQNIEKNQQTQVKSLQQTPNRKYRPKNFQCPACKMAFSNNGQLKNHVRIHTGERPFSCNQPDCNKTFTRNEELTRHKLIHTGVRPHSCTTCGKRFGRKDHLKKHVRTHDRKKLRKKVFVPTPRAYIEEDVFMPPKPVRMNPIDAPPTSLITIAPTSVTSSHDSFISRLLPATSSVIPQPPISSTVDHCSHLYQTHPPSLVTSAMTAMPAQTTTTTTSAIQQLASDYWNKWYNLLGLYHHQHYPPSGLFRE